MTDEGGIDELGQHARRQPAGRRPAPIVTDTHPLVWWLYGDDQLSRIAQVQMRAYLAAGEPIVVPAAVLLDVRFKIDKNTPDLDWPQVWQDITAALDTRHFDLHPIDDTIIEAMASVPRKLCSDPVDRLIIATAITLDARLVTRDRKIREAGLVPVIW